MMYSLRLMAIKEVEKSVANTQHTCEVQKRQKKLLNILKFRITSRCHPFDFANMRVRGLALILSYFFFAPFLLFVNPRQS